MRGFRWLFGLFFIGLPMVLIGIGAGIAWRQSVKLTTYRPVEATVLSTRIDAHRGKSTSYSPRVEYRYNVGGRQYVSSVVTPISESSGHSWAQGIINCYAPGGKTTAYCDPNDPAKAFLVHEYSFFPYMFMLFPMIHLSVGVVVIFGSAAMRSPMPASPPREG